MGGKVAGEAHVVGGEHGDHAENEKRDASTRTAPPLHPGKSFDSGPRRAEDRTVRKIFLVLPAVLLLAACGTPYGMQGSLGGVKVWEHPHNKVEITVVGRHTSSYDMLAQTWKRKADETAWVRGASRYDILSFSTGREVLGFEVIGEASTAERYADESVFWLPKVARGVIKLQDPKPRGWARTHQARSLPAGFTP